MNVELRGDDTHERWLRLGVIVGLVALGLTLFLLPYLPLQDVPQQIRMLAQQREFRQGTLTPFLRVKDEVVFGYALYRWIDRLLAHWLSPEASLRAIFLLGIVALPWSAGRLARCLGGSPWLAALLVLPMALSLEFRLGLAPFMLGIPCVLLALRAALELASKPTFRWTLELAIGLALAEMAHPLTLLLATLAVFAVWVMRGIRTAWSTAALASAAVPASLLLAHDLAMNGFGNVEGIELGWPVPKVDPQGIQGVLCSWLFYPYGSSGLASLLVHVPLLVATMTCLLLGFKRSLEPSQGARRRAVVVIILCMGLVSVLAPRSLGTAFGIGGRFAYMGMLLLTVLGAGAWPLLRPRPRVGMVAVVLCALAFAIGEFSWHARNIRHMVGDRPPRNVSGALMVVRLHDCRDEALAGERRWDTYDPYWHLWAYAVTDDAATSQTFAFARYHHVQFRSDNYASLVGAPDWEILSNMFRWNRCESNNLFRLLWGLGSDRFDRILTVGMPLALRSALARAGLPIEPISPGILLIHRDSRKPTGG